MTFNLVQKVDRFYNIYLLDKTSYPIDRVTTTYIPADVQYMEKHIIPNLLPEYYQRGVYQIGNKEPIVPKGIYVIDGIEVSINNRQDFLNVLANSKQSSINILGKTFYKNKLSFYKNYFTDVSTYPILSSFVSEIVNDTYMAKYHVEADAVLSDPLGISTDVSLVDKDNVLISGDLTSENIISEFFPEIFRYDIIETYEPFVRLLFNRLDTLNDISRSTNVEIKSDIILIKQFVNPYTRRYGINKYYKKELINDRGYTDA